MELTKLIQTLNDAKFKDKDGDEHRVLFWDEQRTAVSKIIYEWGAQQISDNELHKRLAELEAKCFAYEKIIANSNFRPFVTDELARKLDTVVEDLQEGKITINQAREKFNLPPISTGKINCKSTKCENCINHGYCFQFKPRESEVENGN